MSKTTEPPEHYEPRVDSAGKVLGWKVYRHTDRDYDKWPDKHFNTVQEAEAAVEPAKTASSVPSEPHPLEPVFQAAIDQCTKGKGVRHGGATTPFLEQPWRHYAKMHGRGFLTGQATKKLEEAASTRQGEAFVTEALGAIAYIGMAILGEWEATEKADKATTGTNATGVLQDIKTGLVPSPEVRDSYLFKRG